MNASKKVSDYRDGDIVKYTAKFLQSVGGATGWPRRGTIIARSEQEIRENGMATCVRVRWDDGETRLVQASNIMHAKKPDYSGM